jgi:hypothetical protein
MKRDDIHDLLIGAALVGLAYAFYRHSKVAGAARSTAATAAGVPYSGTDPTKVNSGVSYDPANPGQALSLSDLLRGAVHDVLSTGSAYGGTASSSDIVGQAVTDAVNPNDVGGDVVDSVVRVPGALW